MAMIIPKDRAHPIRHWKLEIGGDHIAFQTNRDMEPEEVRRRILEAVDALLPERSA